MTDRSECHYLAGQPSDISTRTVPCGGWRPNGRPSPCRRPLGGQAPPPPALRQDLAFQTLAISDRRTGSRPLATGKGFPTRRRGVDRLRAVRGALKMATPVAVLTDRGKQATTLASGLPRTEAVRDDSGGGHISRPERRSMTPCSRTASTRPAQCVVADG